jgi:hypothetical protein
MQANVWQLSQPVRIYEYLGFDYHGHSVDHLQPLLLGAKQVDDKLFVRVELPQRCGYRAKPPKKTIIVGCSGKIRTYLIRPHPSSKLYAYSDKLHAHLIRLTPI